MSRLSAFALSCLCLALALSPFEARADSDGATDLARAEEWLTRLEADARRPVTRSASGEKSVQALPDDFRFKSVERDASGRVVVHLDGDFGPSPSESDDPGKSEELDELRLELFQGAMLAADIFDPVKFYVRAPDGTYRSLDRELTAAESEAHERIMEEALRERERVQAMPPPTHKAARLPKGGALIGKRIALSPGHGWTGSSWQRSLGCNFSTSSRGILEDTFNAQMVAHWIIPMLENMGAEIILVREPDMSTGGQAIIQKGTSGYSETGSWGDGSSAGGWDGDYRTMAGKGGTASFTHTFSTSGWRRISAWYLEGTNRTTNAVFRVRHAGGETLFDVDQTQYGRQFLDLGKFWCAAGEPCGVTLENGSDGYLIADAVKIGSEDHATYKKPWWQMQSLFYVRDFLKLSSYVSGNNVTTPPTHATAAGADLYMSFHGNAAGSNCTEGSTAHGISTHRHNCSGTSVEGSASNCDHHGGKAFAHTVHDALIARVRADWDANYCSRGVVLQNLGEVRVGTMPSILFELGFFDNLKTPQSCRGTNGAPRMKDNQAQHDPRWREAVAYGIADGLAKYVGMSGAPPIRPTGLKAINGKSPCALTVSWNAVSGATAYRLYRIDNVRPGFERAYDAGTIVEGTSVTLSDLTPGKVYAFRVTAMNASGEGFPSAAVTARVLSFGGRVEGLYVNGYDRRDAWVQEQDNDLSYAAEHGIALGAVADDFFFDGVLKEVVESGGIDLNDYAVVDYQAGKNSTEHHSVSSAMQQKLTSYLGAGGKLFISGEELAYDLGYKGNGTDFLESQLKTTYANDDAGVFKMSGTGPFAGLSAITFDDGTRGTYEVVYPDALSPKTGGTAVMSYDGTSYTAAIESANAIAFGLPLETVYPAQSRAQIFACGIGRLLRGASWTCTPSSISAPASGAVAGTCTDPTPVDPPDAGTDPDLPDDPEPDAGTTPTPEGDAGTDPGDSTDSDASTDPEDPTDPFVPGDSDTSDDLTGSEGQTGQSIIVTLKSGGCSSVPGAETNLPLALLLALAAFVRRRLAR